MSGLRVQVSARGADGFRKTNGPALVRSAAEQLGQKLAEITLAAAAPNVPVDEGGLLGSGEVALVSMGAMVRFTAHNALFVHGAWNSGASRSVPHWPPPGALAGWASRHGIPEFLVRKAISEKGTELVPFLKQAFEARNGYDEAKQEALHELAAALKGGG